MARDKAPLDGNDRTQRRVYVLPTNTVEGIIAFQKELGLASEVEAVRRLLDEALRRRDNFETITARLVSQFKSIRSLREAAREVLVDHPLVKGIWFEGSNLRFKMVDDFTIEVDRHGAATIKDENDYLYNFGDEVPEWASTEHPRAKKRGGGGRMNDVIDDDIPF